MMDFFRGEAASPPDENLAGLFVPFENRAGADAELAANVNGTEIWLCALSLEYAKGMIYMTMVMELWRGRQAVT